MINVFCGFQVRAPRCSADAARGQNGRAYPAAARTGAIHGA